MSDETNGNGRLDRIEAVLAETAELQRETQKAQLQNEFKFVEYRKQSEERFARIESVLDHLAQLAGIFGDRTIELENKAQRVKEAL